MDNLEAMLRVIDIDDLKLTIIEQYATLQNIEEIELRLIPLVNWDEVNTQSLISLSKANPENALSQSIIFKQKCKF